MHHLKSTLFLAPIAISVVSGDLLGPTYPAPTDLSSDQSLVRAAWENASAIFDSYLKDRKNTTATKDIAGSENVTFSASLFSLHDDAASALQYHYTGPQIANSANGTKQVDGDSIYRIASVSKLITTFAGQIGITEEDWMSPVTKILPEFAANVTNPLAPEWNKITLWALASQLAGIQPTGILTDLIIDFTISSLARNTTLTEEEVASGLPPVGLEALGPCQDVICPPDAFAATYGSAPAQLRPYKSPSYSNFGFFVLGLAISRITGKPYDTLYLDEIFRPLGMDSSFANAPTNGSAFTDHAVVAGPLVGSYSAPFNLLTLPSGGILSTINDLNKLGVGLLNNTLLSKEKTDQWMRPLSHSASLSYSVGAPWEIVRYVNKQTGKVTDIYGKLGDSGAYGGLLALIPDYNAGFTFLNALYEDPNGPQTRGNFALRLINHIAEAVIPALEAQAAEEAQCTFVGTYESSDPEVKSTLVVAFNQSTVPTSKSGLSIESWISNGTDFIESFFRGTKPRLLLSIPKGNEGAGNVTFQAAINPQWLTYEAAGLGPYSGFYDSNFDWATFDGPRYGRAGLRTFTFDVSESGKAVSVTNSAARLVMKKQ